ncbi:MAG: metallophosphoesterase [Bacteroidales bacterium]|nr:metallophosphoesterase [Bacteroidales bacterium]
MKIQFASDLHLEFPKNKEFLKANPLQPSGEVLILAGDIVPFAIMDKHNDFFDYVSTHFQQTWWIPGNHEYYRSDITQRSGTMQERIRNNVHLVNNITLFRNNIRFIFSSLWSKINPGCEWEIEKGISDFQLIKYKGARFTSNHYNDLHEESLDFLKTELKEPSFGKTIVVTHHAPTFNKYPEKYQGDILNGAFAVELSDLIVTSQADCWIYGHIHYMVPDYYIGKTKMISNQLGYVEFGEHKLFRSDKIIKL